MPTLQYVVHPSGGYVMDGGMAKPVRNATVFGLRTVVNFNPRSRASRPGRPSQPRQAPYR
jgi:hypothetical protein